MMAAMESLFTAAMEAFARYHTAHLWFRALLGIGGCVMVAGMLLRCWWEDGFWPIGRGRRG